MAASGPRSPAVWLSSFEAAAIQVVDDTHIVSPGMERSKGATLDLNDNIFFALSRCDEILVHQA